MTRYNVTCYIPDNIDEDRRIQGVGGPDYGGWYMSVDEVIARIAKNDEFWTKDHRTQKQVKIIVTARNGRLYIKTETDYIFPDNILQLQICTKNI